MASGEGADPSGKDTSEKKKYYVLKKSKAVLGLHDYCYNMLIPKHKLTAGIEVASTEAMDKATANEFLLGPDYERDLAE